MFDAGAGISLNHNFVKLICYSSIMLGLSWLVMSHCSICEIRSPDKKKLFAKIKEYVNLPITRGVKLPPHADLFTATAEPLGVKRCTLVTFSKHVGVTRRHLYDVFNCFRLLNMAAEKPEIGFFIVFLRKTSAVHLLLGYKIHFTDRIHVFGVGELNGAIKMALNINFETGNDK
jgi:hypothetical protein